MICTIIKVHPRPRTGLSRWTQSQAIGKFCGGIITKIVALADALGKLVSFPLRLGQAQNLRETTELFEGVPIKVFLAYSPFDANWLRENLDKAGFVTVIPPKSNRKFPREFYKHSYQWWHLFENYFQRLMQFKRIALRACKTDQSFPSMIYLPAAIINSR